MPISRRTSPSTLEPTSQSSGVYCSALGKRIDDLDEAFEDEFPDLPSLMPGPRDVAMTRAPLPKEVAASPAEVPDLVFDAPPARSAPALRTSSSANIAAVRPPELLFDSFPPVLAPAPSPAPAPIVESRGFDSFDDDNVDISLDIKAAPKNQLALQTMSGAEMSPASGPGRASPAPISSTQRHDPRPGIVAFSGFGLPPGSLGATPAYALRVIARKWTLRDDLRIARLRRIQDVSLYEAALASADEGAVTKGIAVIAATLIGGVGAIAAAAAFLL